MSARAPDSPLPLGTVLRDTYELVSVLGTGAMGTVFLARHLRLPGKQVAVKVLHAHEEMTATQYARFRREAQISSRITHPNIVSVLDFNDRENGMPFLVMEHLKGESLARRLKRGRPPLADTLSIARQMGAALHAAHQVGVIHRDLKPDNVFLLSPETGGDAGPRVKLLDFGISKIVSSRSIQTRDDVLLGTPRYMSPEQAQGLNSTVDARSDLFSLGAIVYEMLCGEPPFTGAAVTDILYRIVYDPPKPLAQRRPELPAHVCEAVERALAKKPDQRYPDVASFISRLTDTAPASTARIELPPEVGARTVSSEETVDLTFQELPPPPPASPVKQAAIGAGVALLLAAVAIGGWLFVHPEPEVLPAATANIVPPAPKPVAGPAPVPTPAPVSTPVPVAEATQTAPSEPAQTPLQTPALKRPPPRTSSPEPLPEAVRADLEEARRALEAGNPQKTIEAALRGQRKQPTSTGFALLTQAYCRQGDLGRAKAQFFKVHASEQGRVRQYCKRYDVLL